MENPVQKKSSPWRWVAIGCGVLAVGALAVIAIAVVLLLRAPAVQQVLANPGSLSQYLPGPSLGSTPAPNSGSGGESNQAPLPFKFSAITDPSGLAAQSLMDQMTAALNLNNDTDFMAPKTYKGAASLDPSAPFMLGNGWCAKDDATLKQNMQAIQYAFSIDGVNIDLSKYPTLYFTDNRGDSCAISGLLITPEAQINRSYHMILAQKFLKQIDDGITGSPYPAGDVTFDFTIEFTKPSNPGTTL